MKFLFALNKACELMFSWIFEFLFCKLFLGNSYSQSKAFADAWVFCLEKDPSLKKKGYFFRSILLNRVVGNGDNLPRAREFADIVQKQLEWIRKMNHEGVFSEFYCRIFAEKRALQTFGGFGAAKVAVPRAHQFAHLVEERTRLFKEPLPQVYEYARLVMAGLDSNVAERVAQRYVQIFKENEGNIPSWKDRARYNNDALEKACSEYSSFLKPSCNDTKIKNKKEYRCHIDYSGEAKNIPETDERNTCLPICFTASEEKE